MSFLVSLCVYCFCAQFVDCLCCVGTHIGSDFNIQWRSFAKKAKDGKRDTSKKGHGHTLKVTLSNEELNAVIDYDQMIQQMEGTLEHLHKEYAEQLSLRTSVAAFDSLAVDTPDGQFPLIQIAQVIGYFVYTILCNNLKKQLAICCILFVC